MALKKRGTCRLCNHDRLTEVLHLTPTPPANAFTKTPDERQPFYPLELFMCASCKHVQLLHVVDPAELFRDYVYVSGTSKVFREHFDKYAAALAKRFSLPMHSQLVVEIGSNDGTLLKAIQKLAPGTRILGVDPAKKIAEEATKSGVETVAEFFNANLADDIIDDFGEADLVIANNVFAHIDDLESTLRGVHILLKDGGTFVFEVGYVLDQLFKHGYWDNCYHEHVAYHSVGPLQKFLTKNDFTLLDVERVNTHGGSIRCFAKRNAEAGTPTKNFAVARFLEEEENAGIHEPAVWKVYAERIQKQREEIQRFVDAIKSNNRSIAAFGAPAKATTLLHHLGLNADIIDFVVDESPLKQGLFVPGLGIPVVKPEVLYEENPDYCVVLAWNFADDIIQRHKRYGEEGGFFVVPLPSIRVFPQ